MDLYTILEQDEEEKVKNTLKKKKTKKKNFKKCTNKKNHKKNKKQKKRNMKNRKKRSHQKRNSKKNSGAINGNKNKRQEAVNITRGILTLHCSMLQKYKEMEQDLLYLKSRGREAKEQIKWRVKSCMMSKMEADIDELFRDNAIETGLMMKNWNSKEYYE